MLYCYNRCDRFIVTKKAIIYMFCSDLHLTLTFPVFCKKICLKESEVWQKVISNKSIVTLVTQGLPSSSLSRPVA